MIDPQLHMLPLEGIRCEPQVRSAMDEASLRELAQSIREQGVLVPILVRRDELGFYVVDGHRRLRAASAAGLAAVPAVVQTTEMSGADVLQIQLVTACQREELSPTDKAKAIEALMRETGWTASKVAARLGLSEASVSRLLALLALPTEVLAMVSSGQLPLASAYELTMVTDPGQQLLLARQAGDGTLSRAALRRARTSGARPRPGTELPNNSVPSRPKRTRPPTLRFGPCRLSFAARTTVSEAVDCLENLILRARNLAPQVKLLSELLYALRRDPPK